MRRAISCAFHARTRGRGLWAGVCLALMLMAWCLVDCPWPSSTLAAAQELPAPLPAEVAWTSSFEAAAAASAIADDTRIYFPLTLPGVLAGVTLVYVLSIGFFITPALLGGGKVPMIGVLIEQQVHTFLNWGFAAALSAVLLTATLIVYALMRVVLRGNMRWT